MRALKSIFVSGWICFAAMILIAASKQVWIREFHVAIPKFREHDPAGWV